MATALRGAGRRPGREAIGHFTLLVLLGVLLAPSARSQAVIEVPVPDKTFDGVMMDLDLAISEHNFAVVGRNALGDALRKQGIVGFPRATVVQICNLKLGRAALRTDPALLAYMPCRIGVYQEPDGGVRLFALLLPRKPGAKSRNRMVERINRHLRAIVRFAARPLPGEAGP